MKKIIHYLKVYYRMPQGFKNIFWRAVWWSLLVELDLKLNNFCYFKRFRKNQKETAVITLAQKKQVAWVRKSMRILEHRAPWKPMCLNRAVTAKRLLKKQGIETTFHLGFKARASEEEAFKGHAWLTLNGFFITGLIPEVAQYKKFKSLK